MGIYDRDYYRNRESPPSGKWKLVVIIAVLILLLLALGFLF